jgi:hypothetical protein
MAGPRELVGATETERRAISDDRCMGWLVGALARGDAHRVANYREWYGEELYAAARALWDGIQGRQVELRAQAMAVLAGQLDDPSVAVRGRAAQQVVAAIDAQNINRTKFDDLRDPDEFRRAVEDVRLPTPPMMRVFRESWSQPCSAVKHIAATVVQNCDGDEEMSQLLNSLGWRRS